MLVRALQVVPRPPTWPLRWLDLASRLTRNPPWPPAPAPACALQCRADDEPWCKQGLAARPGSSPAEGDKSQWTAMHNLPCALFLNYIPVLVTVYYESGLLPSALSVPHLSIPAPPLSTAQASVSPWLCLHRRGNSDHNQGCGCSTRARWTIDRSARGASKDMSDTRMGRRAGFDVICDSSSQNRWTHTLNRSFPRALHASEV